VRGVGCGVLNYRYAELILYAISVFTLQLKAVREQLQLLTQTPLLKPKKREKSKKKRKKEREFSKRKGEETKKSAKIQKRSNSSKSSG